MITRFYVDNYKCLVNFEYKPQPLELIIGANGSGKSTVFEALSALRDFVVGGALVDECFPVSALTRWQNSTDQTFRLEVEVDGIDDDSKKEELIYEVSVKHDLKSKKSKIIRESVESFDSESRSYIPLFLYDVGTVHLFRDDGTASSSFSFNASRSALTLLPALENTQRATAFRRQIAALLIVHINPMAMHYATEGENPIARRDFSDFASWYRHHSQEQPQATDDLREDLREVLEDFDYLQLTSTGSDRRELRMKSKGGKDAPFFRFDELSDGQRALIVLYAVLHFAVGQGATVCIDEPENFVALRELQPFMFSIEEKLEESGGQVLLISHNSEFINRMPVHSAVTFQRSQNQGVEVEKFSMNGITALTPAELVARGWEHDGE